MVKTDHRDLQVPQDPQDLLLVHQQVIVDPQFHTVHHIVIKMGPQDLCRHLKGP